MVDKKMSENLLYRMPKIKRARDYYFYDEKGDRYLDLYLDKGRAICGHRPNGLSNTLKNTISRGLYAPYPSVFENRLKKVIKEGFPQFSQMGIYRSIESFNQINGSEVLFLDPALDQKGENHIWRPFLETATDCPLLKISLPFPGNEVVIILSKEKSLPPSEMISPLVQAGLVRSWFDLQNFLQNVKESDWAQFDKTGHWKRKGPYLQPQCKVEEYAELFELYLKNGILISPDYATPSISLGMVKEGSLKKLYKSLGEE